MSASQTTSATISPATVGAILYLTAPHDRNGNPRGAVFVIDRDGVTIASADVSYAGERAAIEIATGGPAYDYPWPVRVHVTAGELAAWRARPVSAPIDTAGA